MCSSPLQTILADLEERFEGALDKYYYRDLATKTYLYKLNVAVLCREATAIAAGVRGARAHAAALSLTKLNVMQKRAKEDMAAARETDALMLQAANAARLLQQV